MKIKRFLITMLFGIVISAAIASLCVFSGVDWEIARFFEQHPIFIYAAVPGVITGMIVPIIMVVFYFFRSKKNPSEFKNQLVFQLSIGLVVSFLISTLLKSLTNRVDMEPFEILGETDFSASFRFGFMNGKDLWESLSEGWPSGHTFVAITFFVLLKPFLNENQNRIHLLYVVIIMLSVVTSFHWFSDVLSGAILGVIVAKNVQLVSNHSIRKSSKSVH